jgi:UDP-N-acetylmuramoyl-L-alanyl-D-glutamate--2,6-diaminopimelate ligase
MQALQKLLQGVVIQQLVGNPNVSIKSICQDSRAAGQDSLFIAVSGTQVDGHAYIPQAIEAGSKAIVCESLPALLILHMTYVVVAKSSQALGLIAANFYENPSAKLKLVAVTGTSGKTSTVHLLYGLFKQLGYQVGLLSTIYNKIHEEALPAILTTPDALQLNELLVRMVEKGCQYCFMEASSHAIVQERIAGLQFAGAVFLNMSHDHLDYHKTFDAYIQAKKKLFDDLPKQAFALYNADDRRGKVMMQNTQATAVHSFAMKSPADFTAKILANTWQGLALRIAGKEVWFRLLGDFNAYNLLAAYATACLLGQDSDIILIALSSLAPILGRFQCIQGPNNVMVIVDYAHKPDALEKVLTAIDHMKGTQAKVITVVGCGGNRDAQKRPLMAKMAVQYSDQVVFTSDNPRYEDPDAIIAEMMLGLTPSQQRKVLSIVDRKNAIKVACQLAHSGDIVLIAGKGHEAYQEIKGEKFPLSDAAIVHDSLIAD